MVAEILALVKARLGISTTIRDVYLTAIIEGIIKELSSVQGIVIDESDKSKIMFISDYAEYRYSNRDNPSMPRHLQWRLHNLMTSNKTLTVIDVLPVNILPDVPTKNTVYILPNGTMEIYIVDTWTIVKIVNGVWVVV